MGTAKTLWRLRLLAFLRLDRCPKKQQMVAMIEVLLERQLDWAFCCALKERTFALLALPALPSSMDRCRAIISLEEEMEQQMRCPWIGSNSSRSWPKRKRSVVPR